MNDNPHNIQPLTIQGEKIILRAIAAFEARKMIHILGCDFFIVRIFVETGAYQILGKTAQLEVRQIIYQKDVAKRY